MHSLHRVSAVAFYTLGVFVIAAIVLVSRGVWAPSLTTMLNILDLPLLASGMLYAGSSLVLSLKRDRVSVILSVIVFGFLAAIFTGFAIVNFWFPFAEIF